MGVATLAGLGLGMSTLVSTGVVPVVGRISDRAATRWQVVSVGLLTGVIGFALLAVGFSWSILFGLILLAITSASNTSLSTALVGDLSGSGRRSRRLGVLYTVGDLGSAIGPPLAFGLLPLIGLQGLYLIMGGLLILMLALSIGWSRHKLLTYP
jgi:MFS family permease